jgi:hypothetical protein
MNLKGFLINKVMNLRAKWICIIVSICLKTVGRASNVKLTMLDPIGQIFHMGENFD